MKSKFSTKWKGSKQPRKQRKYRANAPIHIKRKLMSAHLSDLLRRRYKKRNFPLRKGDLVKVMRGESKGKAGKIEAIDYKRSRVTIGGIIRAKKDGTKVSVYFSPSNLLITELNLDDKKRIRSIERKSILKKQTEEKPGESKKDTKQEEKQKNVPTKN
jgi:large subunit ribosomal protein L24